MRKADPSGESTPGSPAQWATPKHTLGLQLAFRSPSQHTFVSDKLKTRHPELSCKGQAVSLTAARGPSTWAELPQHFQEYNPSTAKSQEAPGHLEQELHTTVIKCRHTEGKQVPIHGPSRTPLFLLKKRSWVSQHTTIPKGQGLWLNLA